MPKEIKAGTTNIVRYVNLVDDTTGAPATGLTVTAINLQSTLELTASATKIDAIVGTGGATSHVDDKVFEMDATDSPGLYMVCWRDTIFAVGNVGKTLILNVTHASTHPATEEIILTADDMANLRDELNADPIDVQVAGMDTDTITADALAADALAEINAEVDTALSDYDGPTDAEMQARTLVAASYFDPSADAVANVTTVATTTTNTDMVAEAPSVAATADAVWDEVLTGATHNVATSAGKRLRELAAGFTVHSGTAQAGSTSTTFKMDTGASTTDNIYSGDRIIVVGGTGTQEHGIIVSYVGSTRVATMADTWVITPDNTSEFEVVPADVNVETVQHAIQTAGDLAALIATAQADLDIITGADGVNLLSTTQTSVDAIEADTNELQSDDVPALIAAVKAETALIVADTNELQVDDVPGLIAALNDLSAADVNAQLVSVLESDVHTEISAVPAAAPTILLMLQWLYQGARNRGNQTGTQRKVYKDDSTTVVGTSTVSDDTTTAERGKFA